MVANSMDRVRISKFCTLNYGFNCMSIISVKSQFFGNAKECSNYHTIPVISRANKVMLKILQARLQQYVNCEIGRAHV